MAAQTGVINASQIGIYVVVTDVLTKIATITSAQLSLTQALRETTSHDSLGWETYAPGKRAWELSGDSLFAFDAAYGFSQLFDAYLNRTELQVYFSTESEDDTRYKGAAFLTALSASGSTEENETYSFTLKGSGALSDELVPAPEVPEG